MPKPKPFLAGKSVGGNATKAPKLPQSKKKKQPRADAESGNGGSGGHNTGGGGRRSKKSKRSVLGFVAGALACVGLWGWSLFEAANKRTRDRRVLTSMRRKPLVYTDHARCRMDCRFVSEKQVEETLKRGQINDRKSEPKLRPSKYAVDAEVAAEGGAPGRAKNVQAVFSAGRNETVVVTVIDTGTEWPCGPC